MLARFSRQSSRQADCNSAASVTGAANRSGRVVSSVSNGRQMSAWLGLVPRQHSSGEHNRLFGIGKRGGVYVRSLLIHGARSVVLRCKHKSDLKSRWLQGLIQRCGFNRACLALANQDRAHVVGADGAWGGAPASRLSK